MKTQLILLFAAFFCTNIYAQWVQKGTDIGGEATGDRSGRSVALSSDGSTVAIGAYWNDGNGANSGQVRVYQWNGSAWAQKGLDIDGEAADDQSGYSLAISSDGNTLAVGAPQNDGNGSNAGHVRVYNWNGTAWIQKGLDIDGEAAFDKSGWSVSIAADGNAVAIGAIDNNVAAGHVRVYEWSGTAWTQKGTDIDGEMATDWSGYAVSLSSDANTVAIGAPSNNASGTSQISIGHVRVYNWNGTSWIQKGTDIDGESAGDDSGTALSLSADGNTVAIGAPQNAGTGTNSGHVRVYNWNGTSWAQKGLDIDGEAAGDRCGNSLSISADGNTLAIGAYANTGNGTNAGHVRIFEWNGTAWIQKGTDIDGEASGDFSAYAVSLSADGNIVAIGAYANDGVGVDVGHVRIYEFSNPNQLNQNLEDGVVIYPNPSTGNFYVDMGASQAAVSIIITDLYGKLIQSKQFEDCANLNINIDEAAGIYLLSIITEDKKVVFRLIKN